MTVTKAARFIVIVVIGVGWVFSGWPKIGEFPPAAHDVYAAPAPAPAFVACGAFSSSLNAVTPALPGGIAANDILLLFLETANEAISVPTPNGGTWTEVANSPQGTGTAAGTSATRLTVFWSRYNGTQGNPTTSDSGDHQDGVICAWRGAATSGNPWDATSGGVEAASDTSWSITGATTTVTDALVVVAGARMDDSSAAHFSSWTNAGLSSVIERADGGGTSGNGGGIGVAEGGKAVAGNYGATTVTNATATTKGFMTIALKPQLPTYEQSAYRLFNNANGTDVGSALAAQDTASTLGSVGAAFRLRLLLHIGANQLVSSGDNFKLQFAQRSGTCDTAFSGESYADVTGGTAIAYNNNAAPADGDNLTANANDPAHSGHTIANQDYEESNNFTNSVSAISSGQDGKWDFSLIDNGAATSTSYCFRVVKSDSSPLDTYSVIPEIITASGVATISCSTDAASTAFGTLTDTAVAMASPNASSSLSCSGTANGCTLYVKDAGGGGSPGLWKSASPTDLVPSPDSAFSATSTLAAGTEGYGIQATTTASGGGAALTIAARYLQTGNTVGGLSLSNLTLASSTADVSGREVVAAHKAAISATTLSGSYADTITYECVVN